MLQEQLLGCIIILYIMSQLPASALPDRKLSARKSKALGAVLTVSALFLVSCTVTPTPPPVSAPQQQINLPAAKSAGLGKAEGEPLFNFERINDTWSVMAQQSVIVPSGRSVTMAGWAVDGPSVALASAVDISIDGTPYNADYGIERDDVATYLKIPAYRDCGFRLILPAGVIGKGTHSAAVRIVSRDGKSYWEGAKVAFEVR